MFSLHERTQRRVCRAAFVLCCALPTFITVCWILHFHRPWHLSDLEQSLTQELHVHATVAHRSAPRPGERKFTGVELADLRTGNALCTLDARIRKSLGGKQQVTSQQVSLPVESLADLARFAATWLSVQANLPRSASPVDLRMERVEIFTKIAEETHSVAVTGGRVWSDVTGTGSQRLLFEAQLSETEKPSEATSVRLIAERRRDGTVRTFLDTHSAKLPGWLLAEFVPGARGWAHASFVGKIEWEEQQGAIVGNLQGILSGIDIAEWFAESPHQVQAQGTIKWEELTWRESRIESAHGQLELGSGSLSGDLLKNCVERLTCELGDKEASKTAAAGLVTFERLSCRFRLNSSGLTVWGTCFEKSSSQFGALISAGGKTLLMQPKFSDLPVGQFVQVMMPLAQGNSWIPANRSALELAGRLPLPSEVKQEREDASGGEPNHSDL